MRRYVLILTNGWLNGLIASCCNDCCCGRCGKAANWLLPRAIVGLANWNPWLPFGCTVNGLGDIWKKSCWREVDVCDCCYHFKWDKTKIWFALVQWRIAFIIQVRHCVSLKSNIQNYISQFIKFNNYDECTSKIMCLSTGLTTYSTRLINLINQNNYDVWQLWLWLHPPIKAVNLDCLDIAALWCQRAAKLNLIDIANSHRHANTHTSNSNDTIPTVDPNRGIVRECVCFTHET